VYGTAGTIERYWTGSGTIATLFMGQPADTGSLNFVDLKVQPNGIATGQPWIIIGGVKFDKISVSHRPASNLMTESWTFTGTGSVLTGTN
jgi:hypothetical protein